MNKVAATVLIDADREKVFNLLIDTTRHKKFVYGYVKQYAGPEILSNGACFHWHIRLYGLVLEAHSIVSAFDRPSLYQERINIDGFASAVLTKILTEEAGKTRLAWVWEYKPVLGVVGLWVDKILMGKKTALHGIEYSIREIKKIIEEEKNGKA